MEHTTETIEYEATGWDALEDTKPSDWLDFKQGQGDTHVVTIDRILGTRMKSFRGAPPKKHLELECTLYSSNGVDFDPPRKVKTNPRASWCGQIRKVAEELARKHGWDGSRNSYGEYAAVLHRYYLRITRNDNPVTNAGKLDVEILGDIDAEAGPEAPPTPGVANHFHAIENAGTIEDLQIAFRKAWTSTTNVGSRDEFKAAYESRKHVLNNGDQAIPF